MKKSSLMLLMLSTASTLVFAVSVIRLVVNLEA
jgi:hypothetical protein